MILVHILVFNVNSIIILILDYKMGVKYQKKIKIYIQM
jgi:hypothetical protein